MQLRGHQKGFSPLYTASSRALILGSYPSPKSFEYGFYYGHPQNRFWPLIALLSHSSTPQTIAQKSSLILNNHLALWDSLESCEILGASDTSIKNPVPNDINSLMDKTKIEAVFCNGAASHRFYTKYCQPLTGLPATKLPSTSPANAAFSLNRLAQEWSPLLPYLALVQQG